MQEMARRFCRHLLNEMSRGFCCLNNHTDRCEHGMIREQKSQWGTERQKRSGDTKGYRKEMEDVDVKQRKGASTAIRKKAEL